MASKEVTFEEFQFNSTTAAIYVLDKTLYKFAKELKELLTQKCNISVCSPSNRHWEQHTHNTKAIGEISANFKNCKEIRSALRTVDPTVVSIRSYGYLGKLITEAKLRVKGEWLCHDVIIILGHTSVLFGEDRDLIAAFAKMKPTIIAFLGCCGGNTRYGPILTMSYLLPVECRPIIACYRRQVYIEELKNTCLMIGLQYYLHLKVSTWEMDLGYDKTIVAKCAFALAKSAKSVSSTDPTVFINVRYGINSVQKLLYKCDLKVEAVPLSCMQLALYNPMVVDSRWSKIKQETDDHFGLETDDHKKFTQEPAIKPSDKEEPARVTLKLEPSVKKVTMSTTHDVGEQLIFPVLEHKITESDKEVSAPQPVQAIQILEESFLKHEITFIGIEESDTEVSTPVAESTPMVEVTTPAEMAMGASTLVAVQGASVEKVTMNIPVSAELQLPEESFPEHETVIDKVLQQLDHKITTDELSKICWNQAENLRLHEIIPLICEIKFTKLLENTLKLMKTGDKHSWEKVDPLQFLIAVLRGHWGKNSLTDIKTWATYHLMKIMGNVAKDKPKTLHQYKLCCICFVLLFEDSFVRFVEPAEKEYVQYVIIVCSKQDNKLVSIDVTDKLRAQSLANLPNLQGPFPIDGELAGWVDLLQHCEYKPDCVNLYNKRHPVWTIGNQYRMPQQHHENNQYHYKYDELLLCLGALSDGALHGHQKIRNKTPRQKCYNTKQFCNEDKPSKAFMPYFNPDYILKHITGLRPRNDDISYTETKVMLNSNVIQSKVDLLSLYAADSAIKSVAELSTLDKVIADSQTDYNWKKVSSCRFVFAQFITPVDQVKEITGILFYTDSHYGHNLISFEKDLLKKLEDHCTDEPSCLEKEYTQALLTEENVSQHDLIEAIKGLCNPCKYGMLQTTIKEMEERKEFPFIKVGRLTLTYEIEINGRICLKGVKLDECAEHAATEEYSHNH